MRCVRGFLVIAAVVVSGGVDAAVAATPSTTRASVSSTGTQGNGGASTGGTISADGRYVAFVSGAPDLVPNDTNAYSDIFLRDRVSGVTKRVNVGPGGVQTPTGALNDQPEISADGRFVVFRSTASNLVAGSSGSQLYLYDRAGDSVKRVAAPASASGFSEPSISADGSRVAFSSATPADIFVAETGSGSVRKVSETAGGTPGNGSSYFDPDISADGRWVGFTTDATNLATPDTNGYRDVVVKDLDSGAFTRVSVGSGGGEANLHSSTPALSRDGCVVAFHSSASNLVTGDLAGDQEFVRDRCGANTEVVTLTNGGAQAVSTTPLDISDDGCLVTFLSANAVSPAPAAGYAAVLRDRCVGVTTRLDVATAGDLGTGSVDSLRLSSTGRYAVFSTPASNLVGGDSNGTYDVFVRDRATNLPPVADLKLTVSGRRVTADATGSRDPDGPTLSGVIAFGDGSAEQAGLIATREYTRDGTFSVSVTVTDGDGLTASKTLAVTVAAGAAAPPPPAPSPAGANVNVPPPPSALADLILDRVSLSRSRFAVVRKGGKPGGQRGANLSLRLSDAATVTLRFERARSGRKVKGRCVAGARRGARCSLYKAAGSFTRNLKAGTSTVALTGRIGSRALALGKYRLRVSARSADGRRSATRTLSLTIVRAGRS